MVGPPASQEAPQDPSHSQTQETDSLVVIRAARCRKGDPASSGAAGCHQKPPEAAGASPGRSGRHLSALAGGDLCPLTLAWATKILKFILKLNIKLSSEFPEHYKYSINKHERKKFA